MKRGAVWLTRLHAMEDLSLSVSLRNTHRSQTSAIAADFTKFLQLAEMVEIQLKANNNNNNNNSNNTWTIFIAQSS